MRRAAALALLLAAAVAAPARGDDALTGRLLVTVEQPRKPIAFAAARPAGPRVPEIGLVTVRPRAGESLRGAARRIARHPRVRSVDAERRATPRFIPDDPALSD